MPFRVMFGLPGEKILGIGHVWSHSFFCRAGLAWREVKWTGWVFKRVLKRLPVGRNYEHSVRSTWPKCGHELTATELVLAACELKHLRGIRRGLIALRIEAEIICWVLWSSAEKCALGKPWVGLCAVSVQIVKS